MESFKPPSPQPQNPVFPDLTSGGSLSTAIGGDFIGSQQLQHLDIHSDRVEKSKSQTRSRNRNRSRKNSNSHLPLGIPRTAKLPFDDLKPDQIDYLAKEIPEFAEYINNPDFKITSIDTITGQFTLLMVDPPLDPGPKKLSGRSLFELYGIELKVVTYKRLKQIRIKNGQTDVLVYKRSGKDPLPIGQPLRLIGPSTPCTLYSKVVILLGKKNGTGDLLPSTIILLSTVPLLQRFVTSGKSLLLQYYLNKFSEGYMLEWGWVMLMKME